MDIKQFRVLRWATLAVFIWAVLSVGKAQAQDGFPTRPITVIYPYASAGGTDPFFRVLLAAVSEQLGRQVIFEPRGGANGAIGMTAVARASPDGYTLGATNASPMTVLPFTVKDIQFDPGKDFSPVIVFGRGESFILAGPGLKASSFAEVLALAKSQPNTVTYGVIGAFQRLNRAKIESATGAKFLEVPYSGAPQQLTALLGGDLHLMADSGVPSSLERGGRVRIIATNNPKRNPQLPNVPAVAEFVPGFSSQAWHGLVAPAGTPRDRINRLYRAFSTSLQTPKVRELMAASGLEMSGEGPEAFAALIKSDLQSNGELIRKFNLAD